MLAAVSAGGDKVLDTLKLALELAPENKKSSEKLKGYLLEITSEAIGLLKNPSEVAPSARPESVVLAVRLADSDDLYKIFDSLPIKKSISREDATLALEKLERSSDAHYQFANFGEEIRAVI